MSLPPVEGSSKLINRLFWLVKRLQEGYSHLYGVAAMKAGYMMSPVKGLTTIPEKLKIQN